MEYCLAGWSQELQGGSELQPLLRSDKCLHRAMSCSLWEEKNCYSCGDGKKIANGLKKNL